jgi:hypothetical protein
VVGPNPIYDPGSSDPRRKNERIKITLDTQDRAVATQKLREIEHDLILNPDKKETSLAYALRSYREVKAKTSRDAGGRLSASSSVGRLYFSLGATA